MSTYRIEKRVPGQATEYWRSYGDEGIWVATPDTCTTYSELKRASDPSLPAGGVWVRLDDCGISNPGGQPCTKSKGHLKGHDPQSYGPEPAVSGESGQHLSEQLDNFVEAIVANVARQPPTFTIYHLAAIRRAIAQTIEAGDPATPRDDKGRAIWSTEWRLYAQGKAEAFIDECQRVLTNTVTTDERGD